MSTPADTAIVPSVSAAAAPPLREDISVKLETENLIDTYKIVAEWIRFADAKAAVVLTVGGALAGFIIPTLKDYLRQPPGDHPLAVWSAIVVLLYLAWLVALVWCFVCAFTCVMPYRRRGRHPAIEHCAHFHPAGIATKYNPDEHAQFVAGYQRAAQGGFQQEVLAGLLIDAHISSRKYTYVTAAIRWLAVSSVLGLLYLLAIQF